MTKVNEMSGDAFGTSCKEALDGTISEAIKAGVRSEKINEIVADVYSQAGNFILKTGINRVKSAIINATRAASATVLNGILVGSRDMTGKQIPNKYSLVLTSGQHLEISSYDSQVSFQGSKIDIPVPAAVILRAEHDPEYDSWQIISLEKYKMLTKDELIRNLSKVIIPISAIGPEFAYHRISEDKVSAARVVVVSGTIGRMSNEAVFKTVDDGEGGKTSRLDYYLPVSCGREMKPEETLPCVQFILSSKTRGTNSAKCHLTQQRKGTPTILIDDLSPICETAVKKFKDPESQAAYVTEWLKDIPVIVVGPVIRFKRTTGDDKSEMNWVDIGVSCIIDIEGMEPDSGGIQKKLPDEPKNRPSDMPSIVTKSEPIPSKQPEKPKTKRSAQKPADSTPENEPKGSDEFTSFDEPPVEKPTEKLSPPPTPTTPADLPPRLKAVAKSVAMFCKLFGVAPKDISIAILKEKALDIVTIDKEVIPDSIIQQVIDYLASGGAV